MNKRMKSLISRFAQKYLRNESGSVLVIFAAFMVVALGFSALVIDLGGLRLERSRLINAVDAAALAGARELPNTTNATDIAKDYAELNGVPAENVTVTFDAQHEKITVTATAEKDYFFAPILGISSGSTQAQATAAAGSIGGMTGLIPIGIQENVYKSLSASAEPNEEVLITKDNFGTIGSGNWGWVNLAYPNNSNTDDQVEYITNGYPGMIYVGNIIGVDTGANIGTPANMKKGLADTLDGYIASGEVLYIPIIEDKYISGNSQQVEIKGFAAIILKDYDQDNATSQFSIDAVLSPNAPQFVAGSIDFEAGDFGLKGIALVN